MIFLSESTFLGGDILTVVCTPTNVDNINKVELYNAEFDALWVSKDLDYDFSENVIPETWDKNTIMLATFEDNDTSAGNVNWHMKDLSHIIIKIRNQEDHDWITSHVKKVNELDDLFISGKFLAATTGTWDVALLPISTDGLEGTYVTTVVDVEVNKLVILDSQAIHSTFLTDGDLATQSVMPSQAVNTLHNKFPFIVRNTVANYETVTITATFLPDGEECVEYDPNEKIKYVGRWNREIKGWIMNGRTKLLKSEYGDMWLGYITTPVSDAPYEQGVYEYRKLSFGLTETGLPNREKDLYDSGLLDKSVTSDWWAKGD